MKTEMTLDEAILHCEEVANRCDNRECASEHRQLAEWLKELKERRASELPSGSQPNLQPTCNQLATDCISRRDAIDAISCDITVTGRHNAELVAATIGTFADRIKALPSAQPNLQPNLQPTCNLATDCISRADVEQTIEDNILCYTHSDRPIDQDADTECHMAIRIALKMLRKDLRKLPSAQPEIIHCKECKYGVQDEDEWWYCRWFGCRVGEDGSGFCADAERKNNV